MKISKHLTLFSVLVTAGIVYPIHAHCDEIRLGPVIHDQNVLNRRREKENSLAIYGEYIFETPGWLEWAASANPYIYGTVNLEGNTNHGGVGLNWRQHVGKFYAEFGTGLSVHDGALSIFADIDFTLPEAEVRTAILQLFERRANEHQYGSRVLFRNQLAVGYQIDDKWGADVFYEHLSHGGLLSDGRNDGLDSIGLRMSRKF